MTQIQAIAAVADLSDSKSMEAAAAKMKGVTDHELHLYLVMRDTLNATSPDTRKQIVLAQVEADRRSREEVRGLAFRTTIVSGFVGLLGVVLGVALTAFFKSG